MGRVIDVDIFYFVSLTLFSNRKSLIILRNIILPNIVNNDETWTK